MFRKDYDSHKGNPLELLDGQKRYVVGAGINTRDYEERVPALVEAGVDVPVMDSSEGYSVGRACLERYLFQVRRDREGWRWQRADGEVPLPADAEGDFVDLDRRRFHCMTRERPTSAAVSHRSH